MSERYLLRGFFDAPLTRGGHNANPQGIGFAKLLWRGSADA